MKKLYNSFPFSNIDADECVLPGICSQGCTDTVGSFTCSCYAGYILGSDGKSCEGMST